MSAKLRVMRVPKFLKIHPMTYDPDTFQPTEFDVANAVAANPQHVVRYRKDATTGELKSNTNVYRWSDGSVTVSVGGEHYEVSRKALGPPPDKPYSELQDGHYYAASVELSSNLLVTVVHITEQYNIRPNKEVGDEALTRLAERMAEATNAGRTENMFVRTTKDPEMQKRQAEMAEKEREKARRRRENAAAKLDGGMGRSTGRGGLSIGDLEGGRRAGAGRKRGVPGAGKPKRHRPEYDSDDDLPQGVGRHDEYDRDGGFVVGSDDEDMESGGDDDEEDILDEDEDDRPRKKRQRTVEADEDASGDDVEPAETSTRARRRNVIDDEDDE
jgi:RNA polymerase-associated protein LEO1